MSDAIKPPMHGRDHLPGGSDPIPTISLTADTFDGRYLSYFQQATLDPNTGLDFNFSIGSTQCQTNDINGVDQTNPGASWAGSNFSVDLVHNPLRVNIISPGVYIYNASVWLSVATPAGSQAFSAMVRETGSLFFFGGGQTPPYTTHILDPTFTFLPDIPDFNLTIERTKTYVFTGSELATAACYRGMRVAHNNPSSLPINMQMTLFKVADAA